MTTLPLLEAKKLHPKVKDFNAFLSRVEGLKLSHHMTLQAYVHDHEIDLPRLRGLHALAAGLHGQGLELLVQRQLFCQCIAHLGIVVDNEEFYACSASMHLKVTFGNELLQHARFSVERVAVATVEAAALRVKSPSNFPAERADSHCR